MLTITEFEQAYGRTLSETRRGQVETWIGWVSAEVRRVAEGELDDVDPAPAEIKAIVYTAVLRAVENPRGLPSRGIGDYSESGATGWMLTEQEEEAIRDRTGISSLGHVTLTSPMPVAMTHPYYRREYP